MADAKPPAKILRILGNPDPTLERTHVAIYDYLDSLTTLAFTHSVALQPPFPGAEAYTTVETVGFPFIKRRLLNFAGAFLVSDDAVNQRTNVDIGLFSGSIKGAVSASGGGSTNFLRADGVWSAPTGGGITQLTGDGTAGPGSGSQAFTLQNIPSGTTAAGSIVFTNVAAPAVPALGKTTMWIDSTSGAPSWKDHFGNIELAVSPLSSVASRWVNGLSSAGILQTSQPAFSDLSGSLAAGQFGPLTGDVTTSGYVATLANIPTATPAAGTVNFTTIATPATPLGGHASVYCDSTSSKLSSKSPSGTVSTVVTPLASAASKWLDSLGTNGVLTASQPAFTDISGSLGSAQFGPLTGDVTTSGYVATIATNAVTNAKFRQSAGLSVVGQPAGGSGNVADISTTNGTGFALRESSNTVGFGTLSTTAYAANSVTYAKLQNETGNTILGRGSGGTGTVQELTVTGVVEVLASSINHPKELSLTFGGQLTSVGTQLLTSSIYLGVGDNAWSTATNFGLISPIASRKQNITFFVFQENLSGTGSPTYAITLMVGAVPVLTLATTACGTGAIANAVTGAQTWSAFTGLGIRISVASGSVNGGSIGIYVVMRCEE